MRAARRPTTVPTPPPPQDWGAESKRPPTPENSALHSTGLLILKGINVHEFHVKLATALQALDGLQNLGSLETGVTATAYNLLWILRLTSSQHLPHPKEGHQTVDRLLEGNTLISSRKTLAKLRDLVHASRRLWEGK